MVRGVEGRIKQIRKREECRSTFIWRYAGQAKDEEEEEEKEQEEEEEEEENW